MATRILHVEANEDGTVGGTHRALEDLVLRVNRSKFEPVVLFYQDNVHVRTLRAHGIEVQLYDVERARERAIRQHGGRVRKLWDILGAITRRRRFLLANRIDLVHLNNSPKSGYDDWLPAARLIGIPFISFAMGDPILEPRIIRLAARRMDHVIAISDYMKAAMLRAGIREDRLTRVYLGVDAAALRAAVQRPAAATRSALGVPEDAVHVVMVGNIRRWKGQYVLLDALSAMPARTRERIHVSFVGAATVHDGEYQAELEALARASGSGNRVRFLGARNDVPTLLASADIAVHASVKKEPFGLVVPEAMAQGVAVVASKFGGPGEVIDPESHPPPRARDPGRVRYRAESPVDPETVRTGRRATTGAGGGPPGPLSITPTSQRPDDARGRSACAQAPVGLILTFLLPRPPTSTADRTPREARPQGGGHAAARPAALARSSITPYTRPTPIEIPASDWIGLGIDLASHLDQAKVSPILASHVVRHIEPTISTPSAKLRSRGVGCAVPGRRMLTSKETTNDADEKRPASVTEAGLSAAGNEGRPGPAAPLLSRVAIGEAGRNAPAGSRDPRTHRRSGPARRSMG